MPKLELYEVESAARSSSSVARTASTSKRRGRALFWGLWGVLGLASCGHLGVELDGIEDSFDAAASTTSSGKGSGSSSGGTSGLASTKPIDSSSSKGDEPTKSSDPGSTTSGVSTKDGGASSHGGTHWTADGSVGTDVGDAAVLDGSLPDDAAVDAAIDGSVSQPMRDGGAGSSWDGGRRDGGTRPWPWFDGSFSGCEPDCSCVEPGGCNVLCLTSECQVGCDPGTSCNVGVGEAESIKVECGESAICRIKDAVAEVVDVTCVGGGECIAECGNGQQCNVECLGGNCLANCKDAAHCNVTCAEGALGCVVEVNPDSPNVDLTCDVGPVKDCGDYFACGQCEPL